MDTKEFLKILSEANGVSGYEYMLSNQVEEAFNVYADSSKLDKLGNVISYKKGKNTNIKIMLATHMDEIGLIVNDIEENGFLRFTNVGGVDPRTIMSQEVLVHGKESLMGVIGSKPPHLQEASEHDKALGMEDMIIDLGLPYDRVKDLVKIGDTITIVLPNYFDPRYCTLIEVTAT